MKYVYVVEDDDNILELLRCALEAFSYEVKCFSNAEDMLKMCETDKPLLVLLDIMLPGMDGISALKILKKNTLTKSIPVVLVSAKSTEPDKVFGLDMGADDYITKPFGVLELHARIRAVLRREQKEMSVVSGILEFKDIIIDNNKRQVTVAGNEIMLTLKEYQLLTLLIINSGRVLTRDEILNSIWGFDFVGESRTLDIHIRTLRQKLGDDVENPKYIKTIRGVGYSVVNKQV